jgi:hypothetical protein
VTKEVRKRQKLAWDPPEITIETLQNLSFELLAKAIQLWRTYRDDEKSKGIKISKAMEIHDRIIAAMRYHPDITHLRELDKFREEAEKLVDATRKIHPISEGSKRSSESGEPEDNSRQ